jgi:Fic family protein
MADRRTPWRHIAPLPRLNGALEPMLNTVDSLRDAWGDALQYATPEELLEAQRRRLRRHAVETGIIERLYELDWGTTEALVAEGLTTEAANRASGIHEDVLLVVQSQYDALEYLTELVREERDLSVSVIRELHAMMTRHQATYEARDLLGRTVAAPLRHGDWKLQANHVRRPDGSLLEYCPPEHVSAEMDMLIVYYQEAADAHPIMRSAWLHHRLIQIHPFEDGNGRVARALTLLVLLRERYAPLVVDRRQRETYISALDAANDGDLSHLVRFFCRLEIAALQSTLTQPIARVGHADAASLVRAYAKRLNELYEATVSEKKTGAKFVADEIAARIAGYLDEQRQDLQDSLRLIDRDASARVTSASPPGEKSEWWRWQLIQAARAIDFFTNLADGTWWTRLQLEAQGERLRFIAAVQKVGHGETGVLAVTTYAELIHPTPGEQPATGETEPVLELAPTDSVTFAYNDLPGERWEEVEDLLRRMLRAAVGRFADALG